MSKTSVKNKNLSIIIILFVSSILFLVFGFLQLEKVKDDSAVYDEKVSAVFSDCLSLINRNVSSSKTIKIREDRSLRAIEIYDNEKDPSNIFVSLLGTISSFNSCKGFSLQSACIGESCIADKKAMVYFRIENKNM